MQSGDDEVVSEVFSGLRAAATAEGHWRFDFCPLCDQDGDLLPRRPEKRRRRLQDETLGGHVVIDRWKGHKKRDELWGGQRR